MWQFLPILLWYMCSISNILLVQWLMYQMMLAFGLPMYSMMLPCPVFRLYNGLPEQSGIPMTTILFVLKQPVVVLEAEWSAILQQD